MRAPTDMRGALGLVAVVALLCCVAPHGPEDARVYPDVPRDDAPWYADSPAPSQPVVAELTVSSTEPCADWDVVAHPGLATEPELTPLGLSEPLWVWHPFRDPFIEDAAASGRYLHGGATQTRNLAIGPDGSIWTNGPDHQTITRIGRDGRADYLFQFGYGFGFRVGNPGIAPDGTAFVLVDTGSEIALQHLQGPGRAAPLLRFTHELPSWRLPIHSRAIGPGGRVYVLQHDRLIATCRTDRVLWTLRLQHGGRVLPLSGLLVDASGEVVLSQSGYDQLIRVSLEGQLGELAPAVPAFEIHDVAAGVQGVADDATLMSWLSPRGAALWGTYIVVRRDEESWRRTEDVANPSRVWLDPRGRVWVEEHLATRVAMSDGATEMWSRVRPPGWSALAAFDRDANAIGFDPPRDLVSIRGDDGSERWRVPVLPGENISGIEDWVHDVDGRLYVVVSSPDHTDMGGAIGRLVAYQSDSVAPHGRYHLPRDGPQCGNRHCNGWAHDYAVAP